MIGGGQMWADVVTFTTTSSSDLVSPQQNISLTLLGGSQQSGQYKFQRGSSAQIVSSDYIITGIVFNLNETPSAPSYFTSTSGTVSYDATNSKFTWIGNTRNITFNNDVNSTGNGRDIRITSVEVTYTTTDPSTVSDATVQTYPYTWDYTDADMWAASIEELSLYTSQWNHTSNSTADEYRPATAHTDWGYNITNLKGLRFNSATVNGSPCLDYKNQQMWVATGTVITIPSVKAGQKITVTGNYSISGVTNATGSEGAYTASADGDVAITFGNASYIRSISVTKTDVTLTVRQQSLLTKTVGDGDFHFLVSVSPVEALDASLFSVISNTNTGVISISNYGVDTSKNCYDYRCTVGSAGTADVVLGFAGNDAYNAAELSVTFTVNKKSQNISYETTAVTQNYSSGGTYTNTLTQTTVAEGATISYTSSDTNVATVDANGQVTFVNSGVTTITATASETENYTAATASYQLTVQGSTTPTLSWDTEHFSDLDGTTLNYGNLQYCYAVSSDGATDITYSTSDERIATVTTEQYEIPGSGGTVQRCKITPTGNGSVTIYANLAGHGDANPATPISFSITVIAGVADINFKPEKGTINKDKTVTPYLSFPNMLADDIISFTATSSDTNIATVPSDLKASGLVDGDGYLRKVYPTITGVNAGTATITVEFQSYRYANTTATYEVTVVGGTAANFYWRANGAVDGASKTINIVEGDFIMLPAIMGTSNGNNSYSVGSNKQYVYSINKGSIVRNTSDYKLNQGTPDISVSDETKALVFWARGTSETADTLMVFGRAAGDVQLIATDPQTGSTCSNINLHIVAKSTIETADETAKAAMSYPYTWDFTDMDMTNIAADASNDGSWIEYGDVYYSNGVFNYDYADSDNDGNVTERLDKMILANGSYLPAFNGLKVNLPGSTGRWNTKDNRFRVAKNGSYVYFNGGTYQLTLPDLTNVKSTGGVKLFVMAEGSGGKLSYNGTELSVSDKQIYTFDVSSPSGIVLDVDNVRMYWMGVSTEARSTTSYGMASYAYDQSLDFEKSIEANSSLTGAYAVTSFNSSTATLQAVDNAPAATGLVIKGGNSTAYYFVADARNMDEYTERTTTSQLVGVTTTNPFSKPSAGYVYVLSNSGTDNNGKTYNEAGFYNYEGSSIPAQRSYLPVPTSTFSGSSSSGAKGFSLIFLDGEATGISEVTRVNVQDGDAYYNLNGVRVTNPSKGIYIHNGKKIVIK